MDIQKAIQPSWEPLLTPTEAAIILRCHPKTAARYARTGVVPAIRLGTKLWRFRRRDLDDWAAATLLSPCQPNE
jgi:excisionase family DNA binding protein